MASGSANFVAEDYGVGRPAPRAEVMAITCPHCGAKPNRECSKASANGRRRLPQPCLGRELRADELSVEAGIERNDRLWAERQQEAAG